MVSTRDSGLVYVYRDLHAAKHGGAQWRVSAKPKSARVNESRESLVLESVSFKLARGNYDYIQRNLSGGRLVCAFAYGRLVSSAPKGIKRKVSFNPLKSRDYFYYCDTLEPITSARALEFTASGDCYAIE